MKGSGTGSLTPSGRRGRAIAMLAALVLVALLSACGPVEVGLERTATPPVSTPAQVRSAAPDATVTPTGERPVTATSTSAPTALPSATPPAVDRVSIYLIAMDDNGLNGKAVGCGDSVVPVEVQITPTSEPLRAALEALLSMHDRYFGESGLYNALYETDLRVASAVVEDGRVIVHLSGSYTLGGVCDEPRAKAQLEETARQFADEVLLYIN